MILRGQTFSSSTGRVSGTLTSGNPVSYFNGTRWAFGWTEGNNLSEASTMTSDGFTDWEIGGGTQYLLDSRICELITEGILRITGG